MTAIRLYQTTLIPGPITTKIVLYETKLSGSVINNPPFASAPAAQTVEAGKLITLLGSDHDGDGLVTSRIWTGPVGIDLIQEANSKAVSFMSPVALTNQNLVFTYVVTDDQGSTDFATTTVTVLAAVWRVKNDDGTFSPFVSRLIV